MQIEEIIACLADLIKIKSLSQVEGPAIEYLVSYCEKAEWKYELVPVAPDRHNIFISFGVPRVVFTTHVDVVPAPEECFIPRVEDGFLFGRGACDAKGIVACMIGAATRLRKQNATNFGLLFVVGEEDDGIGAQTAAKALLGRGIEYIVNGEPTESKLVNAQKGVLDAEIRTRGVAAHSGYPERGVDANILLLDLLNEIRTMNLGVDRQLGFGTINFGHISAGVAPNVVSPHASCRFIIRLVNEANPVIQRLTQLVDGKGELILHDVRPVTKMEVLPGFESLTVAYSSDVPYFEPLMAHCMMLGPGSIFDAHSDREKVAISELEKATDAYCRIYEQITRV